MDDILETGSSRRSVGIIFVVLLHVVIIYALVSGLGKAVVEVLHPPIQAQIIQQAKPPPILTPPPPPPVVTPLPTYIPPPLIQLTPPPEAPAIAKVTTVKPPAPQPAPPPPQASHPTVPVRSAGLDPNQSCAAPEYPEDAEDMEQTGTSVLQFLIGTGGVVEQARIASSSGHSELDRVALQALRQCKFQPAIGSDGKPAEAWTSIRYVWKLN